MFQPHGSAAAEEGLASMEELYHVFIGEGFWLVVGFEQVTMRNRLSKSRGWLATVFVLAVLAAGVRPVSAKSRWVELNIGPFIVNAEDESAAREVLTQLEQLRWVLGSALGIRDLESIMPIRFVILKNSAGTFQPTKTCRGNWVYLTAPGQELPLRQVTERFLMDNTPPMPVDVERGIQAFFSTLQVKSVRVEWGAPPKNPDLDWARIHWLTTNPDYAGRFRVFLSNLQNGSSLSTAERNAFGKDPALIEKEVQAHFVSQKWEASPVSSRPLDPKRDFGEHEIDSDLAELYLADVKLLQGDTDSAKRTYDASVKKGGALLAPGFEGLAELAALQNNPKLAAEFSREAVEAGSRNAGSFLGAAKGTTPEQALSFLKRASELSPRWAEPWRQQALLTDDLRQREELLEQAAKREPRSMESWQKLAEVQAENGNAKGAQNSWLKAERAAQSEGEREKLHVLRQKFETERLNASEEARKRAADAKQADLDRVKSESLARIRAAETKANTQLETESPGTPAKVEPWWDEARSKAEGALTRVDCLGKQARIHLRSAEGKSLSLLVRDPGQVSITGGSNFKLSCGTQTPAKQVIIQYAPRPDRGFKTAGDVVVIETQ